VIASVLVPLAVAGGALSQGALLDRALAELWSAESVSSREKAADAVARLASDFDGLYQRLEAGPRYSKDVETGLIEESRKGKTVHWLVIEELDEGAASGRVALSRKDNQVEAQTRGVARFRLLLSPRQFDLSQPIEVLTNGVSSYRGTLERSPETLLRWTARDNDRSMLFAAEVSIEVPPAQ
jgi:hypothetical protein